MALPAIKPLIEEQQRPMTFEEYRALPDSDLRVELMRGELIMAVAPKAIHQRVVFRLAIALQEHIESRGLGEIFIAPFDVRLSNDSAVQPDLLFVNSANRDRIGEDFLMGPPDLIVEILSPSGRRIDLVRKRVLYADFGVPDYWIVDPDKRTISVNVLLDGRYDETMHTRGEVELLALPGLSIDLTMLFDMPAWMQDSNDPHEDEPNDDND